LTVSSTFFFSVDGLPFSPVIAVTNATRVSLISLV
jgi:hypothetical protein